MERERATTYEGILKQAEEISGRTIDDLSEAFEIIDNDMKCKTCGELTHGGGFDHCEDCYYEHEWNKFEVETANWLAGNSK